MFQPSIISVSEEDDSRTVQLRHVTPLEVNTLDSWCFSHMAFRTNCAGCSFIALCCHVVEFPSY